MTRKFLANSLGWMSILGSLTVAIEFALNAMPGFSRFDLSLNALGFIWLVAFLFSIAAAVLGSRSWAFAALLPVLMIILAVVVVYLNEPRMKDGSWLERGRGESRIFSCSLGDPAQHRGDQGVTSRRVAQTWRSKPCLRKRNAPASRRSPAGQTSDGYAVNPGFG